MDNPTTKRNRLFKGVLVASLALNLATVGVVSGWALSGRAKDGPPQRMSFQMGPLARVLDRDDRRAVAELMRRDGARPVSRGATRAQMADLAAALRADPFDAQRMAEVMSVSRQQLGELQQKAQAAFVTHLMTMTIQERSALADRLERRKN